MLTETEWEQVQQRLTTAWHQGDFAAAFAEIDRALAEGTSEMKGQALLYRGMIHDGRDDLPAAKEDYAEALTYTGAGSYARYVAERTSGDICGKLGRDDEALGWYRAALETCVVGDGFSGGVALEAFLRLHGQQLAPDDRNLVASVARKSWGVLELPGTPDLKDLTKTAGMLARRTQHP